jgi:(E)-4-hydroxy-3-methylbut-2-enyl-diphosphate synthase
MGGAQPVRVQTMTTVNTLDVAASVAQCKRIADAGADYVRLTTPALRDIEALAAIKKELRAQGYAIPLIADVHFTPKVALAAAAVADKVRINPGNFGHTPAEMASQLQQLITVCKQYHTALRIGVNHGSLAARMTERYGDTPQGMVESAMEMLRLCAAQDFHQVVVSIKSSNTRVMTAAYRLLAVTMDAEQLSYPLHLGVTEAGDGDEGRLKSAVGIGTLLMQGLGDTIRVSLTEPPENEIPVARALIQVAAEYGERRKGEGEKGEMPVPRSPGNHPALRAPLQRRGIRSPFSVSPSPFPLPRHYAAPTREALLLHIACDAGPLLLDGAARDFRMSASINGTPLSGEQADELSLMLLQATRVRFTRPEYIACPGCGRTQFDLQSTLAAVRAATSHLKGLKIAVMGCIVNGPGEMADADYGYVGAGPGKITLYKGKTPVKKAIPQERAVNELLALINND